MENSDLAIRFMALDQAQSMLSDLGAAGFVIYQINNISDSTTFFASVIDHLPLDPPLSGAVNWNALCDSLWNGIDAIPESKVAICWCDAYNMKQSDPEGYGVAIECLTTILEQFTLERKNDESSKRVVFLIVDESTDPSASILLGGL